MGRMPAFFMLAKEVFNPMAASAQTIRNLLAVLVPLTAVPADAKGLIRHTQCPAMMGNSTIIAMSNRKVADMA